MLYSSSSDCTLVECRGGDRVDATFTVTVIGNKTQM